MRSAPTGRCSICSRRSPRYERRRRSVRRRATLDRIARGLRMVTVPLPHLAGLAAAVRVNIDERVPTMGVFASGRLIANPAFVARLKDNELVFVLAHELLHLALRTHDRAKGSGRLEFNYAHDYIINDILRVELGFTGNSRRRARHAGRAREVGRADRAGDAQERRPDGVEVAGVRRRARHAASRARRRAPARRRTSRTPATCSTTRPSASCFPAEAAEQAERVTRPLRELAAKSARARQGDGRHERAGAADGWPPQHQVVSRAARSLPHAWEMSLQRWMESVAPGERTFTRPSRRGADRGDIVLPGRKRESWMLNVVLDTSGSMTDEIPRALGAIADFCDAVAVDQIRVVQCDTAVTSDEVLSPSELAGYRVSGFGGSDLSPAMLALADDPRVTACLIVTDGDIAYPPEEMPYGVLWVLPAHGSAHFRPPYGHVVTMQRSLSHESRAGACRLFRPPRSAVAAPVAQAARPGLSRRGCAAEHDRSLRSGRRDATTSACAARPRARSGAPTSIPAIPPWRSPRSMPVWSSSTRPRSSR